MADSILASVVAFLLLGLGLSLVYFGWHGHRISRRSRHTPHQPTFSESAHPALLDKGIFVDHGMVTEKSSGKVKAQHKRSAEYYKSLTRG